jgi:hypothetical protein
MPALRPSERRLLQQSNDRHISRGRTVSPTVMVILPMCTWQIPLQPLKVWWSRRMPATTTECPKMYRTTFATLMPET